MTPTDKWTDAVLAAFRGLGIAAGRRDVGLISINRTDCHNAAIFDRLHEFEIIDHLPLIAETAIDDPDARSPWICMCGKTDDEWFMEIYER